MLARVKNIQEGTVFHNRVSVIFDYSYIPLQNTIIEVNPCTCGCGLYGLERPKGSKIFFAKEWLDFNIEEEPKEWY